MVRIWTASDSRRTAKLLRTDEAVKTPPMASASSGCAGNPNNGNTIICVAAAIPQPTTTFAVD